MSKKIVNVRLEKMDCKYCFIQIKKDLHSITSNYPIDIATIYSIFLFVQVTPHAFHPH